MGYGSFPLMDRCVLVGRGERCIRAVVGCGGDILQDAVAVPYIGRERADDRCMPVGVGRGAGGMI